MLGQLFWAGVAILCAVAFAIVTGALKPDEQINALWLVVAAACFYALAYRFYGRFLARRVVGLSVELLEQLGQAREVHLARLFQVFERIQVRVGVVK